MVLPLRIPGSGKQCGVSPSEENDEEIGFNSKVYHDLALVCSIMVVKGTQDALTREGLSKGLL